MSSHLETLQVLDPFLLPQLLLSEKGKLPPSPGIYFVLEENEIIYIGKASKSIKARWGGHHRFTEIDQKSARVSFWELSVHESELRLLESWAINKFLPRLNTEVAGRKPKSQYVRKTVIRKTPSPLELSQEEADYTWEEYLEDRGKASTFFGTSFRNIYTIFPESLPAKMKRFVQKEMALRFLGKWSYD